MNKLDKDYIELLLNIKNNGKNKTIVRKDGREADTSTIPHLFISHDMSDGTFPILTVKKVNWKCPCDEWIWMLSGSSNLFDLPKRSQFIWEKWSDPKTGELGRVYGQQMRRLITSDPDVYSEELINDEFDYIDKNYQSLEKWYYDQDEGKDYYNVDVLTDQIKYLEHNFKTFPENRRNVLDLWNLPELHKMSLPACHLLSIYNVTNGQLNIGVTMRSSDVPIGLPYNFCQYGLMMELICHTFGFKKGKLTFFLNDAHIYKDQLEGVKQILSSTSNRELPKMVIKNKYNSITEYQTDRDLELIGYEHDKFIKMPVFV